MDWEVHQSLMTLNSDSNLTLPKLWFGLINYFTVFENYLWETIVYNFVMKLQAIDKI